MSDDSDVYTVYNEHMFACVVATNDSRQMRRVKFWEIAKKLRLGSCKGAAFVCGAKELHCVPLQRARSCKELRFGEKKNLRRENLTKNFKFFKKKVITFLFLIENLTLKIKF